MQARVHTWQHTWLRPAMAKGCKSSPGMPAARFLPCPVSGGAAACRAQRCSGQSSPRAQHAPWLPREGCAGRSHGTGMPLHWKCVPRTRGASACSNYVVVYSQASASRPRADSFVQGARELTTGKRRRSTLQTDTGYPTYRVPHVAQQPYTIPMYGPCSQTLCSQISQVVLHTTWYVRCNTIDALRARPRLKDCMHVACHGRGGAGAHRDCQPVLGAILTCCISSYASDPPKV